MIEKLNQAFTAHYEAVAEQVIRAPGRVNLIGEHTDYNKGFVLPCAVDYCTLVAISARDDNEVRVLSLDYSGETDSFHLNQVILRLANPMWANYIRGVVVALQHRGHILCGANIAVTGNVPRGAGLSSSASLEIAVARALTGIAGLQLSPLELAQVGQDAENAFVGCHCGIMDQLVCASATAGHALGIDCNDFSLTPVAIPEDLSIVIINSNVRRGLVDSEYNRRREQCEAAARYFNASSLRDVTLAQFNSGKRALDPVIASRALHVLEENERTLAAIDALRDNDIPALSHLMAASHRSMKELFEITVAPIDFLVDTLDELLGDDGGVRMTGGGFGGCVVALVRSHRVEEVVAVVEQRYTAATGLTESIYLTQPSEGVRRVS